MIEAAVEQAAKPASVWRNGDFVRLWGSENISLLGSTVTALALPFIAIPLLHATPIQVGILASARYLPYLLVSLPAGVITDRFPRRKLLIVCNLIRATALLTIPITAALGVLRIEVLYVVSFTVGLVTVLFDLSWQAYLPSLVSREQLTAANSQLYTASNTIAVTGPGLAGIVVQALSAPLAIVLDAASFVVSTFGFLSIRRPEPDLKATRRPPQAEIAEGFRMVFGHRLMRPIGLEAMWSNIWSNVASTVLLIYVVQVLAFKPTLLGIVVGASGLGAVLGAFVAGRVARRFTVGHVICGSMVLGCTFPLLLNLPAQTQLTQAVVFVAALFGSAFGIAISNVAVLTFRQAVTPPSKLGRMNSVYRMLVTGFIPAGPLLGGFIAQQSGVRFALLVGTIGWCLAPLWVLLSPVRSVRTLPEPSEA
jgi:MFS family permease